MVLTESDPNVWERPRLTTEKPRCSESRDDPGIRPPKRALRIFHQTGSRLQKSWLRFWANQGSDFFRAYANGNNSPAAAPDKRRPPPDYFHPLFESGNCTTNDFPAPKTTTTRGILNTMDATPSCATPIVLGEKRKQDAVGNVSSLHNSMSSSEATGEPVVKRKRLTAEEKQAKLEAEAAAKREKEVQRAQREAEKKTKVEADAVKKAKRDAEKQAKADAKAAEKADKERIKAEKRSRQEEEMAKNQRAQKKMTMFFSVPTTPENESLPLRVGKFPYSKATDSPSQMPTPKAEDSLYQRMFKAFYVKEHVTMAGDVFDEETRQAKAKAFDEQMQPIRGEFDTTTYNSLKGLRGPCQSKQGHHFPSVRKLMAEYHGLTSKPPIEMTSGCHTAQAKLIIHALRDVPIKFIKFLQDVRPPFVGTISGLPPGVTSFRRLARNPCARDILPLNYDYDSEAEWQEEEGEDVDMDEEEDDADNDDDFGDLLDDSEDVVTSRPIFFSGGMEPESTGLCWEDSKRLGPLAHMFKFRMKFISTNLEHHRSIDPFSSAYWGEPTIHTVYDTNPAKAQIAAKLSTGFDKNGAGNPAVKAKSADVAASTTSPSQAFAQPRKEVVVEPMGDIYKQILKDIVRQHPSMSKVGIQEAYKAKLRELNKVLDNPGELKKSPELMKMRANLGDKKLEGAWNKQRFDQAFKEVAEPAGKAHGFKIKGDP